MIALDDRHLMMIEPAQPKEPFQVKDELSRMAEAVLKAAKPGARCRGWHTCRCGERSDNVEWQLPGGVETNSLLPHYVAWHRGEVPTEELHKLRRIAAEMGVAS